MISEKQKEMITIRPIQVPEEVATARRLILETAHEVFQDKRPIDEAIAAYENEGWLKEMEDIHGSYTENNGVFLVMTYNERIIGTGAICFLEPGICELKRLWLIPDYHGRGLGYRMLNELMGIARKKGYQKMRLTTSKVYQKRALNFYRRIGFHDYPMFDPEPDPDEVALEIVL